MKLGLCFRLNLVLGLVLCCDLCTAPAATKTPAQPAGTSNRLFVVAPIEIPQSVFAPPANAKEGRNPFFPQSAVVVTNQVIPIRVDTSAIVLNGITSPPKRSAMINSRTFEPGEEGEIRLPGGGKELIKCEQIKSDSVIILINGEHRELKLRTGI